MRQSYDFFNQSKAHVKLVLYSFIPIINQYGKILGLNSSNFIEYITIKMPPSLDELVSRHTATCEKKKC